MQAIRSSDMPLAYKLDGAALVTSLPYADDAMDKSDYRVVRKLVQSEMEELEKSGKGPAIDLEGLSLDVETPGLEALGKRASSASVQKAVTRGEYEKAVIDIEQFKDR